jgi:hypothetical protein
MQPLLQDFCPPLLPSQLLDYLTRPETRREIAQQLKKQEDFYGKAFPLARLKRPCAASPATGTGTGVFFSSVF